MYDYLLKLGFIEIDKNRAGGRPVLPGTKFTIAKLLAEVGNHQSPYTVAIEYKLNITDVDNVIFAIGNYFNNVNSNV